MVSVFGRNGILLIDCVVVSNMLNGLCQFPGVARRDIETGNAVLVDPRNA